MSSLLVGPNTAPQVTIHSGQLWTSWLGHNPRSHRHSGITAWKIRALPEGGYGLHSECQVYRCLSPPLLREVLSSPRHESPAKSTLAQPFPVPPVNRFYVWSVSPWETLFCSMYSTFIYSGGCLQCSINPVQLSGWSILQDTSFDSTTSTSLYPWYVHVNQVFKLHGIPIDVSDQGPQFRS